MSMATVAGSIVLPVRSDEDGRTTFHRIGNNLGIATGVLEALQDDPMVPTELRELSRRALVRLETVVDDMQRLRKSAELAPSRLATCA